MINYRILKNALYVYATWCERNSKPDCKLPRALVANPGLFEKKNFACRVRANLVVDMTFLRLI